jgi:hypothetical protein
MQYIIYGTKLSFQNFTKLETGCAKGVQLSASQKLSANACASLIISEKILCFTPPLQYCKL